MGRIYVMPTRGRWGPCCIAVVASLVASLVAACAPMHRVSAPLPVQAASRAVSSTGTAPDSAGAAGAAGAAGVAGAAGAAGDTSGSTTDGGPHVVRPGGVASAATPAVGTAAVRADSSTIRAASSASAPDSAATSDSAVAATLPMWDLEVEEHQSRARVAYFVDVFSGRLHDVFQQALRRQTRYAGLIGDRMRAAGLPQDLTYLAFIESWYDPNAYSKAAAVGMWQFMTRTARDVGLRVDWWVDERRDPVRSTEAAAKMLSSLRDQFGSMYLAAAAYDGGEGRVSRGLSLYAKRMEGVEGESKFFALSDTRYLRPETRDYVPKIIAAALVAKQPAKYRLTVDSMAELAFDSVLAPGGAPIPAVATATASPLDVVRDLNPQILRGMVPEGDPMWVRVPVGAASGFDTAYAALDSATRVAVTRVVTKKGESMASIARHHKITTKQINWYNPHATRLKSGNLVPGQTILVPSPAVVAAARDVPNPAIERYPRRRSSTATRKSPTSATKPATKRR